MSKKRKQEKKTKKKKNRKRRRVSCWGRAGERTTKTKGRPSLVFFCCIFGWKIALRLSLRFEENEQHTGKSKQKGKTTRLAGVPRREKIRKGRKKKNKKITRSHTRELDSIQQQQPGETTDRGKLGKNPVNLLCGAFFFTKKNRFSFSKFGHKIGRAEWIKKIMKRWWVN